MKTVSLNAFPRTQVRRGEVKKLRASGRIPAVIYGKTLAQPQNLEIDSKELKNLISHAHSENLLVDLAVKDDARPKRLALVQEVQHHALNGQVLHVDFHEVAETEKVTIFVSVESTGEPDGVKNGGGILAHIMHKVKARALPKDLPEAIIVEVSHLKIGEAIHLGDIKPPADVEILGDPHLTVLSVAAPITEEQEAAAAAAAAPAEVEMTKEKKEEGAEGAAAAPAKGEKAPAKAADAKAGDKKADAKADAKPAEKKK